MSEGGKNKIFREIIEEAEKDVEKGLKRKNGRNYGIAGIIIGIIGFAPVPLLSIFTGMVSIYFAKVAIENKSPTLGHISGIAGILNMLWFFVSIVNLPFI